MLDTAVLLDVFQQYVSIKDWRPPMRYVWLEFNASYKLLLMCNSGNMFYLLLLVCLNRREVALYIYFLCNPINFFMTTVVATCLLSNFVNSYLLFSNVIVFRYSCLVPLTELIYCNNNLICPAEEISMRLD